VAGLEEGHGSHAQVDEPASTGVTGWVVARDGRASQDELAPRLSVVDLVANVVPQLGLDLATGSSAGRGRADERGLPSSVNPASAAIPAGNLQRSRPGICRGPSPEIAGAQRRRGGHRMCAASLPRPPGRRLDRLRRC
jgi:hypothetical protein